LNAIPAAKGQFH